VFLALSGGLLCAPARAADSPLVPPLPELSGPRSVGLSATVGTASGNEGIFVNPAAIAARRRYALELGGLVERRGADSVIELVQGSVVDAITSPLAAGLAWAKVLEGPYEGSVFDLAFAGAASRGLYLGASVKYLTLDGPRKAKAATVDAGLLWEVSEWVSVGATGYNLVPIGNEALAPRMAGAGITLGNDRFVQVTGEWMADLDAAETLNRYSVGAEFLLAGAFPLRAGWVKDELLDTSWWSAGVGVVQGRFGLDVGYRQSLDASSARTISASFKMYATE
jgi:hypothetical protein